MVDNYDHYEVAYEISRRLDAGGENDWAQRIVDAIETGFTGTEIGMALHWILKKCLKSPPNVSKDTIRMIRELIRRLKNTLR